MLFVNRGVNLGLYLRLHDMAYGQTEGNTGQRSHPARVSVGHRLGIELGTIGIGSPQYYDKVILAVLVGYFLDVFLTLRVKRSGGGSDKALRLDEQRLRASALYAFGNSGTLHAITFADNNSFLSFQFHLYTPPCIIKL